MFKTNGGVVTMKRSGLSAVGGMMCGIFGMTLGGVLFLGGFVCGVLITYKAHGSVNHERRTELHEVRNEEQN